MSGQEAWNIVVGLIGALGGFILRATWSALEKMRDDLTKLQENIGATYVRRDDFRDHAARIELILERIEAKLDGKVDKP